MTLIELKQDGTRSSCGNPDSCCADQKLGNTRRSRANCPHAKHGTSHYWVLSDLSERNFRNFHTIQTNLSTTPTHCQSYHRYPTCWPPFGPLDAFHHHCYYRTTPPHQYCYCHCICFPLFGCPLAPHTPTPPLSAIGIVSPSSHSISL